MSIRLRRIVGTDEESGIVQRIYAAAPTYNKLISGEPVAPGAAARTFGILPDGCAAEDKHMYLVETAEEPVGFTDVIRGYPDSGTAYIGLFIIRESHHGQGIGQIAFRLLEDEISHWNGIECLQLSVVGTNQPAADFWSKMGFAPTGERSDYVRGDVRSENIFFEKQLQT